MRDYRYVIVDVFTDRSLTGNQLAVFTNAVGMSDELMQSLAREIGFSETTFVLPASEGGDFRMRIFTPARELPFAGHPVLGTAFALAGPLQSTLMRIETAAGVVPVMMEREGAKLVFGTMQQPLPTVSEWPEPARLLEALGVTESLLPIEVYDNGVPHVYVMLPSAEAVAAVRPVDPVTLASIVGDVGVNVFSAMGDRVKTRMFMTDIGAVEDAATGSAAGPLAVHLARHGLVEWGKQIVISQGAEIGRPSTLYAKAIATDGVLEQVEVGGQAVVVARGVYRI